jgi:hypothetical protein
MQSLRCSDTTCLLFHDLFGSVVAASAYQFFSRLKSRTATPVTKKDAETGKEQDFS